MTTDLNLYSENKKQQSIIKVNHLMYVKYILGNVRVGIPLNDFSPSHLYVFLKPGPEFLASYVVFNGLRWEVVVCFIDIGGITVDHHYLIFVYTCITPLSTIFQSYCGSILLFTRSFLLLKKCKIDSQFPIRIVINDYRLYFLSLCDNLQALTVY
jgi:hypothetical protein